MRTAVSYFRDSEQSRGERWGELGMVVQAGMGERGEQMTCFSALISRATSAGGGHVAVTWVRL